MLKIHSQSKILFVMRYANHMYLDLYAAAPCANAEC